MPTLTRERQSLRNTTMYHELTRFEALAIAEGFDNDRHTEREILTAWQFLHDTGYSRVEGWYSRYMANLINDGLIEE